MKFFAYHRFLIISLIFMSLTACIKNTETRGYTIDSKALSYIKPNISSMDDVRNILGSPSSNTAFQTPTWYYINTKREYTAFFTPETVEQTVIAIQFNDKNIVSSVKNYDKSAIRDIKYAADITPTAGHKMGLTEQLLGNVGRFSPNDGRSSSRSPQSHPY